MKPLTSVKLAKIVTGSLCAISILASTEVFACQSLSQLHWLSGNWETQSSRGTQIEQWHIVSELSMEGVGSLKNSRSEVVFKEDLRIVEMLDALFFIAKVPENRLPISFKAVACSESSVTFENQSHDFPQRLTYNRNEARLDVRVEKVNGEGFDLSYQRVPN